MVNNATHGGTSRGAYLSPPLAPTAKYRSRNTRGDPKHGLSPWGLECGVLYGWFTIGQQRPATPDIGLSDLLPRDDLRHCSLRECLYVNRSFGDLDVR